jgi:hypothetical protein
LLLQDCEREAACSLGCFGLARVASSLGAALLVANELALNSDRSHRHEVSRQTEVVWSFDREVFDTRR